MQKRYLIGIGLFVLISVVAVLRYGIGPKPIGIMKASFFDRPAEVGAVIYRRLYDPLGREPVVVFGVTPDVVEHRGIVEGFVATAAAEKRPIQVVFKERGLEEGLRVPDGTEVVAIAFNEDPTDLVEQVRQRVNQGQRVLVYTASVLSSHLIKGNPMHRFEQVWGKPVLAISTVGISLRREQEFKVDPPCVGSEVDGPGTANLGCAALLKSRQLYRKQLENSRIVALMDQRGGADMLLFVALPKGS